MRHKLLWMGLVVVVLAQGGTVRQPVLVELFTSEGCSSCPPADQLLQKLDRDQPVAGAQIIVLSEHVDYWNHEGWTDPFSSAEFSRRQEIYARNFDLNGPYTPEMVVDGKAEFVGNDARRAEAVIHEASSQPKVAVRIHALDGRNALAIEVDPLPEGKRHKANVYVAHAAESGTSDVRSGENKGLRLNHVAIVKDIQQVGSITERAGLEKRIPVSAASRLIVFVQESGTGSVLGSGMYDVPK